jgi:lysyl-tRNA synthetase class 2
MEADYKDSLALTEELFNFLLEGGGRHTGTADSIPADLKPPFLRITMEEAFSRWAGFNLYDTAGQGPEAMAAEARRLGLDPPPGLDTAALYDLIFIHAVEPNLPREKPAALIDYPAFVPCLAKRSPGGKTAERWELYVRGIELANCYSEETGAGEVRRYFETEAALKKKNALIPHEADRDYWKNFVDFPRCSGVAMGLDRLVMVLSGRSSIDGVLPFPMD